MPQSIMIVDYDPNRRSFIKDMVATSIPKSEIAEIKEEKATKKEDTDPVNLDRADELAAMKYDIVIYNTLSNPPPKNFISKFKKNNAKSRVLLYTDNTSFSVEDFSQYKLADGMMTVNKGDETNPSRIEQIKAQLRICVQDSATAKWEWVEAYTDRIKRLSALLNAGFAIAGAVIGFIIGDYTKLSTWMRGTQPGTQVEQPAAPPASKP